MNRILTLFDWESRVADCFSMIEICCMTSAASRDYLQKHLYDELGREWANGRSVYNQYERGFVMGMCRVRTNRIVQKLVEFCYIGKDGTLFSTHKKTTHRSVEEFYGNGRAHELNDLASGHFWLGTDKPWFVGGPFNNPQI